MCDLKQTKIKIEELRLGLRAVTCHLRGLSEKNNEKQQNDHTVCAARRRARDAKIATKRHTCDSTEQFVSNPFDELNERGTEKANSLRGECELPILWKAEESSTKKGERTVRVETMSCNMRVLGTATVAELKAREDFTNIGE